MLWFLQEKLIQKLCIKLCNKWWRTARSEVGWLSILEVQCWHGRESDVVKVSLQ